MDGNVTSVTAYEKNLYGLDWFNKNQITTISIDDYRKDPDHVYTLYPLSMQTNLTTTRAFKIIPPFYSLESPALKKEEIWLEYRSALSNDYDEHLMLGKKNNGLVIYRIDCDKQRWGNIWNRPTTDPSLEKRFEIYAFREGGILYRNIDSSLNVDGYDYKTSKLSCFVPASADSDDGFVVSGLKNVRSSSNYYDLKLHTYFTDTSKIHYAGFKIYDIKYDANNNILFKIKYDDPLVVPGASQKVEEKVGVIRVPIRLEYAAESDVRIGYRCIDISTTYGEDFYINKPLASLKKNQQNIQNANLLGENEGIVEISKGNTEGFF